MKPANYRMWRPLGHLFPVTMALLLLPGRAVAAPDAPASPSAPHILSQPLPAPPQHGATPGMPVFLVPGYDTAAPDTTQVIPPGQPGQVYPIPTTFPRSSVYLIPTTWPREQVFHLAQHAAAGAPNEPAQPAAGVPDAAGSAGKHAGTSGRGADVVLDQSRLNKTVTVHTGSTVLVTPGRNLDWAFQPVHSAAVKLLSSTGASARYQATAPGDVTVRATGRMHARPGQMTAMFVILYQVTLHVVR